MDERCIGDILLQDGSVSTDDIAEALAYQRETGTLIGQALLRLGAVAEERLLAALSTQLELDVLDAAEIPSDELALSRAPTALGLPLRWLTAKEAVIWFESEAVDGAKPGRAANGHDPEATNLPATRRDPCRGRPQPRSIRRWANVLRLALTARSAASSSPTARSMPRWRACTTRLPGPRARR